MGQPNPWTTLAYGGTTRPTITLVIVTSAILIILLTIAYILQYCRLLVVLVVSSLMNWSAVRRIWLSNLRLQADATGEDRTDDESGIVLRRLSTSPGESRLENYQDEVRRIRDAIADSSWYADEEPANEDEVEDERPLGAQSAHVGFFLCVFCGHIYRPH